MATLRMRDISRVGRELGGADVTDLPPRIALHEVLARRVRAEVAAYNAAPGPHYVGLVAPEDAVRYSDGHRLRRPRRLDADRFVLAAQQAAAAGLVRCLRLDGTVLAWDAEVEPDRIGEVVLRLERPVIVREDGPDAPPA